MADHKVHDLTPEEVSKGMADGRYLLVDVREPNEVAAEAYPDAVVVPLSSFDPQSIPDPKGKQVVFACRSGKRSVTASLAAQAAGLPYDKHLAGGILVLLYACLAPGPRHSVDRRRITVDVTAFYWHFMTLLWIYVFGVLWWFGSATFGA